jgi:translation initiation factor IF-3
MAEVTGSTPVTPTSCGIISGSPRGFLTIAYGRSNTRRTEPPAPTHRINEQVEEPEVRLIGPDGEQVGVVPIDKALEMAVTADLDLVEVAPQAKPPVCRVMDYGKFRYELQKKEKDSRKRGHNVQIKKIRVSPKIDNHDFQTKVRSIRSFIEDGDKVKVTLMFKGRMITHKELGEQVMHNFVAAVEDVAKLEGPIGMEGHRNMVMTFQKK